jgi:hypothetical protein
LALAASGFPLHLKMPPLVNRLPAGNLAPTDPLSRVDAEALARHTASDLSTLHADSGHWILVSAWLLMPLAAVFPLALGWRGVRRKGAAVLTTLTLLGALFALLLMESFTGYMIGGMLRNPTGVARNPLLRFLGVHGFALPFSFTVVFAMAFWVQNRISQRAERSKPIDTSPDPPAADASIARIPEDT